MHISHLPQSAPPNDETDTFLFLVPGLVVCVPAWRFAACFAGLGASVSEAAWCVFLANVLVTIPLLASAQIGTKYGAPFPVLVRGAFGIHGAKLPALLRAVVGCGWFGIQTFVGGCAVRSLLGGIFGMVFTGPVSGQWVGIDAWLWYGVQPNSAIGVYTAGASPIDLLCYFLFLEAQLLLVRKGAESVKVLERVAAPTLVVLTLAMCVWAFSVGGGWAGVMGGSGGGSIPGGLGNAVSAGAATMGTVTKNTFASTHFLPTLSSVVGFWATMSLNISDFSRFAVDQQAQVVGQVVGLTVFMTAFSVIAVFVTNVAAGLSTYRAFPKS